jgi:hypothetical protein
LRAAFLEESQAGVEHKQQRYHTRLYIVSKHKLQQDRAFQHPGNGSPKLLHGSQYWMLCHVDDCVGTIFRKATIGLFRG